MEGDRHRRFTWESESPARGEEHRVCRESYVRTDSRQLLNVRWLTLMLYLPCTDDQCIEGGKTISHWLFDGDIYDNMSLLQPPTPRVQR